RVRYQAREALTKLPLDQKSAPLLDQILGPARPIKEVFDALDQQYRKPGFPRNLLGLTILGPLSRFCRAHAISALAFSAYRFTTFHGTSWMHHWNQTPFN
ncbi:MAG: hypothetical protein ACM3VT_18735, partial [Solirubrobacterales bacterium]